MALNRRAPYNPSRSEELLVWAISAFARRYSRNRFCFIFLQVLRWFTSLGSLAPAYRFSRPFPMLTLGGFPHSEIPGSMGASP
jgi:hypothetical protein